MTSINISESDFCAVAEAAIEAKERGDNDQSEKLDKIARKMNASLTNGSAFARSGQMMGFRQKGLTWRDVPSVLK